MIYTDGIHLVTDGSIEELHIFAGKIGLHKSWFQDKKGKSHPHYDVWGMTLIAAVRAGAKTIRKKELAVILQNSEEVKSKTLNNAISENEEKKLF